MQFPNSRVFQKVLYGAETVPGTAVAANSFLESADQGSFNPQQHVETVTHQPEGSKRINTIQPNRVWVESSFNCKSTYTEEEKMMLSLLSKYPEQATIFSGVYRRSYRSLTLAPDQFQTYTIDYGSDVRAKRMTNTLFTMFTAKFTRAGASATSKVLGQQLLNTNGSYQVGVNQVNRITITGTPTGGNFTIKLLIAGVVYTTGNVAYNAAAADVQTAIVAALGTLALDENGNSNTACSGGAFPGTAVDVTFQNGLGAQYILPMVCTAAFTGGTSPAVACAQVTHGGLTAANSEVQTATLTGATGGTWTALIDNLPTVALAFDATAATVQTAFQTILGANNVLVSGSAGGPYTITYAWQKAGQPFPLIGYISNLTGGGTPTIAIAETQLGGYSYDPFIMVVGDDTRVFLSTSPITFDPMSYTAPIWGPTTTLWSNNFETDINIAERYTPFWTQDGAGSFTGFSENTAKETFDLMVGYSNQSDTLLGDIYAGTQLYLRVLCVSKTFIGATVYPYMKWYDVPCKVMEAKPLSAVDGIATWGYTLQVNGDVLATYQNGKAAA